MDWHRLKRRGTQIGWKRAGKKFKAKASIQGNWSYITQKIYEMIPQQFAAFHNPYDDDGQLDPPIFSKHKYQCL